MDLNDFLLVLLGLVGVARPSIISNIWNRGRARRLEQLRAGGKERFFEERRQLEAYPIRHVWTVRLLGALVLLLDAARMFL